VNSVAHNYRNAYVSQWNLGVEHQLKNDFKLAARYVGSKGTALNIARNYNQFVNGLRPYPTLSASSPIDPGVALSNMTIFESDGNSSYNALWLTAEKRFAKGLQFNTSWSWSKSIDDNSRNYQAVVIQDSNNIRGDRGLSDFDTRSRLTVSGVYELPFRGNRLKEGWQISFIGQTQTGNPLTFKTSTSAFTGNANLRPNVSGPVLTGFFPSTNGSPTSIGYVQNPSVFVNQGNAFGNLGRNVVIGPGFTNLDIAFVKNTRIDERFRLQVRAEAFDMPNRANFTNPITTIGSSSTGLITGGTRYAAGDFGTSRQIQLSMKLLF
jgi:hypothetical protein